MTRGRVNVADNAGHVTAHILATVMDAGIHEAEEARLDELTGAQRHRARVSGGDAKFHVVEHIDVLEEGASVCKHLARRVSLNADRRARRGISKQYAHIPRGAHYLTLNLVGGIGSYASPLSRRKSMKAP